MLFLLLCRLASFIAIYGLNMHPESIHYIRLLVHTPQLIFLEIIIFFPASFVPSMLATTDTHSVAVAVKQQGCIFNLASQGYLICSFNVHMSRSVMLLDTQQTQLLRSHKLQVAVDYRSARMQLHLCHSMSVLVSIPVAYLYRHLK